MNIGDKWACFWKTHLYARRAAIVAIAVLPAGAMLVVSLLAGLRDGAVYWWEDVKAEFKDIWSKDYR